MTAIDLNADAGESFARWSLGDDAELFRYISTANVACGWHAGDPATMRQALQRAREAGVVVGAHPGYPDKLGFGRRVIAVSVADTVDYILYQVGALRALADLEGIELSHVKPHGALMGAVCRSPELAVAVAQALHLLSPTLPLMFAPSAAFDAVRAEGFAAVAENAADLDFDDDGINIVEPVPGPKDPDQVAKRAVDMAHGAARSINDRPLRMPVRSICIHGDRPNAAAIAKVVREQLMHAGFSIEPFTRAATA